jgi:hypothetical protein
VSWSGRSDKKRQEKKDTFNFKSCLEAGPRAGESSSLKRSGLERPTSPNRPESHEILSIYRFITYLYGLSISSSGSDLSAKKTGRFLFFWRLGSNRPESYLNLIIIFYLYLLGPHMIFENWFPNIM